MLASGFIVTPGSLASDPRMHDLAIIITSLNEASWVRPCLDSLFARAAGVDLEVVVVDVESTDDTVALVRREFPSVHIVRTRNLGFAHANNRGYLATDSRYVLFLNPDTEWISGDLDGAVRAMDARPDVGMAGCRQLTADGSLYPTMRRFMTPRRVLAEAFGAESLAPRAGQRVLDMSLYEQECAPEWIIGSFMLTRREALLSAGCLDERYFLYSEEEDLCRRIRQAGWDIRHLPQITIVHHVGKAGVVPRLEAQRAYARLQYGARHGGRGARSAMRMALATGYGVRLLRSTLRHESTSRTALARGLRVTLGLEGPPFVPPPATGLPAGAATEVGLQASTWDNPDGSPTDTADRALRPL